jgi:hypothetical protein
MVAWVVIFSTDSRQPSPCRHMTKFPSPPLLLFPTPTNGDSPNSFRSLRVRAPFARRIRSYEKCRVSFALSSRPSGLQTFQRTDVLNACKSFKRNTYEPPVSVANKRLTASLNPLDATLTKNRGAPLPLLLVHSLLACVFSTRSPVYPLE